MAFVVLTNRVDAPHVVMLLPPKGRERCADCVAVGPLIERLARTYPWFWSFDCSRAAHPTPRGICRRAHRRYELNPSPVFVQWHAQRAAWVPYTGTRSMDALLGACSYPSVN